MAKVCQIAARQDRDMRRGTVHLHGDARVHERARTADGLRMKASRRDRAC
jgi:hypothetical protein